MIRHLHLALVATVLICNFAYADFVISIGNSNSSNRTTSVAVNAGGTITLGLYIHNDLQASTLDARTFGLAFDLSLPGSANFYDGANPLQLNSIFSNFAITPVVPGNASISDPNSIASSSTREFGYDVFVDFTASQTISIAFNGNQASAIHLANISFKTAASTPIGTYGFKFNPDARFPDDSPANGVSSGLGLAVGPDGSSFNRFTVTAVPEPSSLLLGGIAMGCIGWQIRRKHHSTKKLRSYSM